MIKRAFMLAALALALAGCGSNVKLDESALGGAGAGAGADGALSQGAGQSSVTQVEAGAGGSGDQAGPVGATRVIYFDFDSFVVKPEYQESIGQHAGFLQADGSRNVYLEGHTDARGSREYNLALGQKRAEAVQRALALMGANNNQMEPISFGEENPAELGNSDEAYSLNRRVEIRYR